MKKNLLLALLCVIGIVACAGFVFVLFRQERKLAELSQRMPTTTQATPAEQLVTREPAERVITKSELWRPIQEKVKDTVVQVFSQVLEFNFLEPYKTPNQYSAYGTAFFINDQGDLITNAHVVNQAPTVWIQVPSL